MAFSLASNIFTIAAGLPFLRTLSQCLCEGTLVEGFRYDPRDPHSLADVTIYVPTRRSARVLRSEFLDLLGGTSAILPVIKPLGETDDDAGFFDEMPPAALDMAEPLSGPARLLELAALVLAWRNRLPAAITRIHEDSPLVAPASPADAVWLSRNLAEIIDAMETEELDWEAVATLDTADHALWWQLTLEFLRIASVYWPERLKELNASSPSIRRNATLHAEAERYRSSPCTGPVVVAGSTGSIPATAALIGAVAQLGNGAVVLPGLDTGMPRDEWMAIGLDPKTGLPSQEPSSRSHPQYGLHRLLSQLGVDRDFVRPLGQAPDVLARRTEFISSALLPVEATARWAAIRDATREADLLSAFEDVSLIEAANEREEATAIAVSLRLALEGGEDRRVALITPDRKLARRVAAELQRFGIDADDSAGTPLLSTPQGGLVRLLLEAALRPGDPVPLISLLKHPLSRFGMSSDHLRDAATALELIALRGASMELDISALEPVLDLALGRQASDRKPPPWRNELPEGAAEAARNLAVRIAEAAEPLSGLLVREGRSGRRFSTANSLANWAERTGRALESVAIDENGDLAGLWSDEAGDSLATLLRTVMESECQIRADGPQWCDLFEALCAGETIKPRSMRDPRVFIFGALESRLQSVDAVVIGGLNEGTWPGQTSNDAFLSRTMKVKIGLEPPERRIGQLGHDFQMATATPTLILTRSLRSGTAPTVASRWLQRLLAVGGDKLADALRKRGDVVLGWVGLLDQGENQLIVKRPEPTPPAELQPRSYSFSEVGRLRRDPYAIYARRVLRLHPLDPFNMDPGPAERGSLYHAIVDRFVRESADGGNNEDRMQLIIAEEFDRAGLPAHIDAVWRPRFIAVAKAFLSWHEGRQQNISRSLTEVPASLELGFADMRLTGIADRIDILPDGRADIIDYKTGSTPSVKVARSLLDPQLALEAAALKAGGFRGPGKRDAASLLYVRLKPGERFAVEQVNNEDRKSSAGNAVKSAMDLAADSLAELEKFVLLLLERRRGFASRLVPEKERDYGGEYDHLARVAEWSSAEDSGEDDDA